MGTHTIATPGAYINEINAIPNAIVPVASAVPAFIGYTPKTTFQGDSYVNRAQKISSFADFQQLYAIDNPPLPADPAQQYNPQYYLVPQDVQPQSGSYLLINGVYYSVLPDPSSLYYLYNSVRLFYQNGGGDAYIVSVGSYGPQSKLTLNDPNAHPVNLNVSLKALQTGLVQLQDQLEPTMYIFPDATLLSTEDNACLMQSALSQAQTLQTVVCIFDVIGGAAPDPTTYTNDIQQFRDGAGNQGLEYGVCYYPFVGTTVTQSTEIDFTNLFGGDSQALMPLLNPSTNPNPSAAQIIRLIGQSSDNKMQNSQLQAALLTASPVYENIIQAVLDLVNILPASGAMAGIYSNIDHQFGVWQAPANTGIVGVSSLPIRLTDMQQGSLNVDPVSGKSINAIRQLTGRGIVVWGARTLDGNSNDWRYINVRRTMIYIEQSIKLSLRTFAFEANDANTWIRVKSMVENFLLNIWKQGGLQGAKPEESFFVNCGLGNTMTADDILNGYMNVTVGVALLHPAEFIIVSMQQKMGTEG